MVRDSARTEVLPAETDMRVAVVGLLLWTLIVGASGCTDSDRAGLTRLYNATGGAGWRAANGWDQEGSDCCQWTGITCTDDGRVKEIDLPSNGLVGELPAWGSALQALTALRLHNNTITGTLASLAEFVVANPANMIEIDLSHNRLSGPVPAPLFREQLKRLDLSGNRLSGEINSKMMGAASQLQDIDLRGNQLLEGRPRGPEAEAALVHANKCLLGCTAFTCPPPSPMIQKSCQLCSAPPRDRLLFRTAGTIVLDMKMLGDCDEFSQAPPSWYIAPLVKSNITEYAHWPTQFRVNGQVVYNEPWNHRQFIPGPQGHGHLAVSNLKPGQAYRISLPGAEPITIDEFDSTAPTKKEWAGIGTAVTIVNMVDDYCDLAIDPKTMIRYRDTLRTKVCVDRLPQANHVNTGPFGQHKMVEIKSIEDPIRNPLRDETLFRTVVTGFKEGVQYSIMVCGEDDEGVFPMSDAVNIEFKPTTSHPLGVRIFMWVAVAVVAVLAIAVLAIMFYVMRIKRAQAPASADEASSGYQELGDEENDHSDGAGAGCGAGAGDDDEA